MLIKACDSQVAEARARERGLDFCGFSMILGMHFLIFYHIDGFIWELHSETPNYVHEMK